MERIAIYYRVSTDKQDLESQKVAIDRWLGDLPKKPKSIHVIQDEGMSGKHENRPGYKELLGLAINRKIDTIVVYRLDRLSRNATVAIKTLLELDEYGVGFISVSQPVLNLGHANPFRRTMLAAFAEIAEIERETIVARVRSGLDAARRRGVVLGAPVKVNDEAVSKARALRAQGLSYKDIAAELGISVGSVHKALKAADVAS
ncbi:MAG: recombinase family protein [bacterium]|jgi:DNA invertase Pin-like site-specific DNA recombinase